MQEFNSWQIPDNSVFEFLIFCPLKYFFFLPARRDSSLSVTRRKVFWAARQQVAADDDDGRFRVLCESGAFLFGS